ncbi:hypothetical protein HHK36_017676 [Tetracentron sinense]|uniref:Uncharacterized protein n=1 Tax=Tetracentron sinense TaxID=13715 RepID=A0A835DDA5_TETSI|nr:hypothetical protein HHK36_017676 [Tetracentron sinense]
MAKVAEDTEKETWGTWEELLLTCAVRRHGTKSWDSVAMEIQNRSSSLNLLTAQNCEQKYHDLKCRFMEKDDKIDDREEESETEDRIDRIPWLDELRKLRVAELRREVQQYDVSIVSLQLKVNRLKEQREHSLREENSDEKPDLEKDSNGKYDKKEVDEEQDKSSPASVTGNSVPGEVSDRENQSFNESNSTEPKGENRKTSKPEPLEITTIKPDPVSEESKPAYEGSFNGSSDTIVKGGEEEEMKDSSDVQSSANLSKKKRRMKVISGSSGEEPETDEVSPAIKRISVKSQPLISFLEIIWSHKYGSLFHRRLESQETVHYRNLIRQHIDLETVRTRMEEGRYLGCTRKFFRDMLLLFNNAIVFFPQNSDELIAATELRELVSKELATRTQNLDPSPEEPPPPKPEALHVKPKISVPMIACRKRSSVSAKESSSGVERKEEQRPRDMEEKPVLGRKKPDNPSANVEEKSITKKRTRERSSLGVRSSRTSSKSRSNKNPIVKSSPSSNAEKNLDPTKTDKEKKKKNNTSAIAKKRSAAKFLTRMKRNSPPNGTLLETLKRSVNNSNNGKGGGGRGAEQKRGGSGRKDQVSRKSSAGKQVRGQSSPAKRSVGRPPKKTAAPSAPAKRVRETAETEILATRQPRKRSRR